MQAKDTYAHPAAEVARLHDHGLLHRFADGYYVVVPQDMMGRRWMPGLEAAAAGIASAIYGADNMGVGSSRYGRHLAPRTRPHSRPAHP